MKHTAKILWIDTKQGNGIAVDLHGNEYYFDRSVFKDFSTAERKDLIEFDINKAIKDCLCAYNVFLK